MEIKEKTVKEFVFTEIEMIDLVMIIEQLRDAHYNFERNEIIDKFNKLTNNIGEGYLGKLDEHDVPTDEEEL